MRPAARRITATLLALGVTLVALYAVVGFFVLPAVVERELPNQARARLGASASVGDVDFNPFSLAFAADHLRLDGSDGRPLARVRRLDADLRWSSLFRRGWHFDAITLDAPVMHLELQPDGRLNLASLGGGRAGGDAARGPLPDFTVGALRVSRANVHFTDRTRAVPETHSLRWVDVALDRLSTRQDVRGDLLATAVLPRGGAFATRARLSLEPLAASGALRVSNLSAALPWSLMREPNGVLARGRLDLELNFDFAYRDRVPALQLSAIAACAEGLALHESGNGPTPPLALKQVEARDARFDLQRRELIVPELRLSEGAVRTAVSADGTLSWQRMFGNDTADTRAAKPLPSFRAVFERIWLDRVDVDYLDHSRAQPLRVEAHALTGSAALALSLGAAMQFDGEAIDLAGRDFVIGAHGTRDPPDLSSASISLRGAQFDFAQRLVSLPEVTLARGALRFDIGRDGQLNWQRLFAGAAQAPPAEARGDQPGAAGDPDSWRILLPGLRATGMNLALTDRTRARPLSVQAADVGGSLDLAIAPGEATGTVALDAIRLKGRNLIVREAGAGAPPALQVNAVETQGGHFRQQDILLTGLHLRGGELRALTDARGASNWAQLTSSRETLAPRASAASRADADQTPWRIRLPNLRAEGIAARYDDATRAVPLSIDAQALAVRLDVQVDTGANDPVRAEGIELGARGLRLGASGAPAALRLARVQAQRGTLVGRELRFAQVNLADGVLAARVELDGSIDLQRMFTARAEAGAPGAGPNRGSEGADAGLRVRLARVAFTGVRAHATDHSRESALTLALGTVSGELGLEAGPAGVQLRDMSMRSGPVSLRRAQQPEALAQLQAVELAGGFVDTRQRSLGAQRAVLRGGALALTRGADGRIEPLNALARQRADTPAEPSGGADWRYRLRTLQLEGIDVALADRSFGAPIAFDVSVNGAVHGLDSGGAGALDLRLAARQGGTAAVSGNLGNAAQPMKLRVKLDRLPLEPLQPLIGHYAALDLKSGSLGGQASITAPDNAQRAGVRVAGELVVDDLLLDEVKTGERFLAWKRLQLQPVNFDAASRRLVVGQAVLDGVLARLEISREGELNLKQVLRDSARGNDETAPAQRALTGDARDPAFIALVDRLRIRNGSLRFSDRSLILPFVTDITQFNGTIVSLSNRREDRAQLQVDGRVQPFGAARARGAIQLADPRAFTDIRAEFNNVPLPKLSPYTITFAGRAVAEGRLWLDLNYKIVDGNLVGENHITMQDLRLGERVAAPRAMDLPLELAAALLTDEQGQLSIRVPVRGDLDNPTFDYKTVIRAAISNTLRRAVSAPFRFIGRLFGPDVEELDSIEFEPGSATLRPPEQEKLNVVAKSLSERPLLDLEVQGTFASEEDSRALRALELENALAGRMKLELGEGERMGPIAFGQAATQIALEQLFEAQFGGDAAQARRARLAREAGDGKEVRRVDRADSDPIAAAGDPDLYREMFEQLVPRQPIAERALQRLASIRADAVLRYIVGEAGLSERRLSVAAHQTVRAEDDRVPSELRLRVSRTGKEIPVRLETVDEVQPEEREAASAEAAPR
jgi:uncharacterized protein involved in outer membrane biogenesis